MIIYADVLMGKDKGRLNFDVGLHYTLLHANTNIDRDFAKRTLHVLSPSLRMKYELAPSHHITVNYEYEATGNALTSLVEAKYLKSFNQVISSNLDQFYSNYHRVSLTQLLMLPLSRA